MGNAHNRKWENDVLGAMSSICVHSEFLQAVIKGEHLLGLKQVGER